MPYALGTEVFFPCLGQVEQIVRAYCEQVSTRTTAVQKLGVPDTSSLSLFALRADLLRGDLVGVMSLFSARGPLTRLTPGDIPEARPTTVAGLAGPGGTLALGDWVVVDIVRVRTGGRGEGVACVLWVIVTVLVTRDRAGVVVVDETRRRPGEIPEGGLVLVVVDFLSESVWGVVLGTVLRVVIVVLDEVVAFAEASPGLSFLCNDTQCYVPDLRLTRLTWTAMHTIRCPPSLTVIDFGVLSRARKSMTRTFPWSVPAYRDAPSGENSKDVNGARKDSVRNNLNCKNRSVTVSPAVRSTYPFSLSKSTSPTLPSLKATAISVLLNGLHVTATMLPAVPSLSIVMTFAGAEGRVVS